MLFRSVQEIIASFNAKYPDIKVTVEYLDYTNGDDQVNTAIEGGSAPDLIMEGPERLVANWGAKGVMAPLNDLWTDDAKKDIYESVESACKNDAGDYYEYPLCMTAHCMAVNMTKVKEVGADKYINTDTHTWSTDDFLATVDALYKDGDRAYSSYISLAAPFKLAGLDWTAEIGATPWANDFYNVSADPECSGSDGFAVCDISLGASKEIKITDSFSVPAFAKVTVNPRTEGAYFVFGLSF